MSISFRLRRLPGSLTLRVFGALAGILVVFGVILGTWSICRENALIRSHIAEQGHTLAGLLADEVRLGVYSRSKGLLTPPLGAVARRRGVLGARVLGVDGVVLAVSGTPMDVPIPKGLVTLVSGDLAPAVPTAGRITFWAPIETSPEHYATADLYFGASEPDPRGVVVGYVAVDLDTTELARRRHQTLLRDLEAGAVFLVLAFGCAYGLADRALAPLRRLADRIGRDHPGGGKDELGILSNSFDHLVASLDRSFETIEGFNRTLQTRVDERTRDLARVNDELSEARDRLEERVRKRTLQLEQAHRHVLQAEKLSTIGQLSASIAHEFNNPIFGVRNVLTEVRCVSGLDEGLVELVDLSLEECDRMGRLIRELQGFNRPTTRQFAPVDVNRAVEAVLVLCRKHLSDRNVRVELGLDPTLPAALAVEDQVRQVVLNLVYNARNAMAGGGVLRIRTAGEGKFVVLTVADEGSGVPPDRLETIFEPFYTTKPSGEGTGLGLTVVRQIVDAHGGELAVRNLSGAGAEFTVRLPVEGPPS